MTTPLIKYIYKLNQALSVPYFCNVLFWDSNKEQWRYETKQWKRFVHFFISFGLILPSLFISIGMRFVAEMLNPGVQTKKEQIMLIFSASIILYVIPIELALLNNVEYIAQNTNQHIEFERKNYPKTDADKAANSKKKMGLPHIDLIGLGLLDLVAGLTVSCFLVPTLLVYNKLDYIYFAMFGMSAVESDVEFSTAVILLRFILMFVMLAFEMESIRTEAICLVGHVVIARHNLQRLFERRIGHETISLYNQLQVMFAMGREFYKQGIQQSLLLAFVNFVLFISIAVTRWDSIPAIIVVCMVTFAICTIVGVIVAIYFLVDYYELSKEGLSKWKSELGQKFKSSQYTSHERYVRKTLKAKNVIAAPLGNVGIVDTDLKTNYLQNTFEFTINSIMAMNEEASLV
ncbi:unnamed protein product [Orchesella dallaii]|uniref:Odorant receptor n=1 Tax=Orchesella dallaii TaxID=48710 RepID=A0ABP1RJ48_9HEXA